MLMSLTTRQKNRLIKSLLLIPSVSDNQSREDLSKGLPAAIRNSWSRRPALKADVRQLLEACLNYTNGVDNLLKLLREDFEDDDSVSLGYTTEIWLQIGEQVKLFDLLKTAAPDVALVQELYGKNLPHGINADQDDQTIEDLISHLGELEAALTRLHPLLTFVEMLASHLPDQQVKQALQAWTETAGQTVYFCSDSQQLFKLRQQLTQPAKDTQTSKREIAHAMIELIPSGNSQGQPAYGCEVVFWDTAGISHHWQCVDSKSTENSWTLAALPQRLAELFRINAAPRQMIIEFILPDELLSCDVDQWDDKTRRSPGIKVGMSYPVVVRPLTRMKDAYYRQRCHEKWQFLRRQLDQSPRKHFHWICGSEPWNAADLVLELEAADDIFCIGLTFMPQASNEDNEILDLVLDTGLPVALWPRFGAEIVDSHEKIKEALNQLLDIDALLKMPEAIKQIRRGTGGQLEALLGNHLTLLWDDPTRILPKYADETDYLYEPEQI